MWHRCPAVLAAAVVSIAAHAAPTLVAYDSLQPLTLETFESHSAGPIFSVEFNGFSISWPAVGLPGIYSGRYCSSKCLIFREDARTVRRLSDFAPGTTQVGLSVDSFWRLGYPPPRKDLPDTFVVTVLGHSGTLELTLQLTEKVWLAFEDQAGLLEVAFDNQGSHSSSSTSARWNYSIDDVVTVAAVPEPGTALLVASGLLAILSVGLRRRRRGSSA